MDKLERALRSGLLLVACLVGLQVSWLIRQAAEILNAQHGAALAAFAEVQSSMALARAGLAEQQGYYRDSARHIKALTRAAAIDAIRFGRLIENADARMERLTVASERALGSVESASESVAEQTDQSGREARQLLAESTATIAALRELAEAPEIRNSLTQFEASNRHLTGVMQAGEEAIGYIRDMLSPTKKSFWRRLLELMIPRAAINVGR